VTFHVDAASRILAPLERDPSVSEPYFDVRLRVRDPAARGPGDGVRPIDLHYWIPSQDRRLILDPNAASNGLSMAKN
jgi:hypothetical protein